jgi:hypothetical protein
MSGGVSDRHWRDALGLLKVGGERLDHGYMGRMAAELGVSDLLEQTLPETG